MPEQLRIADYEDYLAAMPCNHDTKSCPGDIKTYHCDECGVNIHQLCKANEGVQNATT